MKKKVFGILAVAVVSMAIMVNVSLGLGNKAQTSIELANIEALAQIECFMYSYYDDCSTSYVFGVYCGYCIVNGEYFELITCYGSDWLC